MTTAKYQGPFLVGLTGGIGSGKTRVSQIFADLGITIIDADIVAREVVAPGTDGLNALVTHFGDEILNADNSLNRGALRQRVFTSPAEKTWLDNCLHPRIRKNMLIATQAVDTAYGVLVVPLLIENNMTGLVDRIAVVDCPETIQLSRAMQRDGSSEEIISNIMAAQVSRQARLAAANDVIDNSGSLDQTQQQVYALHKTYLAIAEQRKSR